MATATKTLTRQPIMLLDDSNERLQLANKAEALLGYSALRKHLKQPGELGRGLKELGIEPFNIESVRKYKNEMQSAAQRELDSRPRSMRVPIANNSPFSSMGSLLGVGGLGRSQQEYMAYVQYMQQERQLYSDSTYRAEWSEVALAKYGEPVPEYVLNKAIEIKEKCPSATFLVDSLVVREERRTLDPFLIVRQDDETYYVEVWDEPKFEVG